MFGTDYTLKSKFEIVPRCLSTDAGPQLIFYFLLTSTIILTCRAPLCLSGGDDSGGDDEDGEHLQGYTEDNRPCRHIGGFKFDHPLPAVSRGDIAVSVHIFCLWI
jgi:hypothetical protein